MHDELKEAIAKIHRAAKENEKSSGIYSTSGDQAREFADQGFNMVSPRHSLLSAHVAGVRYESAVDAQGWALLICYCFMQVSVMTDMVALPAYMTSALTTARGSYVHSALNMGKGAMSGLAKMTGSQGS